MNRTVMVVSLLALLSAGGWWLYTLVVDATKTEMMAEQIKLIEQARIDERQLQEKANDVLEQQTVDLGNVAASLALDVERLRRERPTRPALPSAPRATCADANGAELDADNASFLTRYSALAARQQIELNTCRVMYNEARDKLKPREQAHARQASRH